MGGLQDRVVTITLEKVFLNISLTVMVQELVELVLEDGGVDEVFDAGFECGIDDDIADIGFCERGTGGRMWRIVVAPETNLGTAWASSRELRVTFALVNCP